MRAELALRVAEHWSHPAKMELRQRIAQLESELKELRTRLTSSNEVIRGIARDTARVERERCAQVLEAMARICAHPATLTTAANELRALPDREG
jgi:Mg2+ and Co2+ transporter CorA